MNNQEFDRIIKEKLSEVRQAPTEDGWLRLQQQMQHSVHNPVNKTEEPVPTRVVPINIWMKRVAAVLLPIIGAALVYIFIQNKNKGDHNTPVANSTEKQIIENSAAPANQNNTEDVSQLASTETSTTNNMLTSSNNEESSFIDKNNSTSSKALRNTILRDPLATKSLSVSNNIKRNSVAPSQNIGKDKVGKDNDIQINPNPSNTQSNNLAQVKNIASNQENKVEQIDEVEGDGNVAKNNAQNKLPLEVILPEKPKKLFTSNNINVVAGTGIINGNSQTSNFNFGVNTERVISERWYLDATVAYVNNNPTAMQNVVASVRNNSKSSFGNLSNSVALDNATINSFGVNPSENSFRAGGNNIDVNELQTDTSVMQAIAYRIASSQLQALPMIGYKVNNRISFSTGIDALRMLPNKKEQEAISKLFLFTNQNMSLRNWDAGVVGKAEFKLNRKVTIGYRQRFGLTNRIITSAMQTNFRRNYSDLGVKFRLK